MGRLYVLRFNTDRHVIVCGFCRTHVALLDHLTVPAPATNDRVTAHIFRTAVNYDLGNHQPETLDEDETDELFCVKCGANFGIRHKPPEENKPVFYIVQDMVLLVNGIGEVIHDWREAINGNNR